MSAPAVPAGGASVLDRLQVLRFAPTPLRGAPAATWTQSPRTGVGQLPVPGTGLQPWLHDTTTTSTDPAGSTLATPDFGPKNGVHLRFLRCSFPSDRLPPFRLRGVNEAEKEVLPGVPGEQPVDEASPAVEDLAGYIGYIRVSQLMKCPDEACFIAVSTYLTGYATGSESVQEPTVR